jgi:hypothetical protein
MGEKRRALKAISLGLLLGGLLVRLARHPSG